MVDMGAIEAGDVGDERMRRMKLAIDLGRNRRRAAPTEGFDGRGDELPRSSSSNSPFASNSSINSRQRGVKIFRRASAAAAARRASSSSIKSKRSSECEDAKRVAP